VEIDAPAPGTGHSASKTFIGTAIAFYAIFDTITLGVATTAFAIFFNPLIVFIIAAVVITIINDACCVWLNREWGNWVTGPGKRVEAKLEKLRSSRIMRHPVDWATRGPVVWFALAAALVNAICVTVAALVVGGKPVGALRIRIAAIAYGIFFAGVYSLIGWGARTLL
jgi:hypothetical protein